MDATRIIDVAIIGGGLVGASLALGLLKHKHINVRVYESAHNFGDIGAGIGMAGYFSYNMISFPGYRTS